MTYHDKKQRPGEVDRLLFHVNAYDRFLALEEIARTMTPMDAEVYMHIAQLIMETQDVLSVLYNARRKLNRYLAGGEFDD